MSNLTITHTLKGEKARKICVKYGIRYLALFGSRARGDNRLDSDVDLLVRFRERKSLLEITHIECELMDLLGKEVDLVTERSVPLYLKNRIIAESNSIYEGR